MRTRRSPRNQEILWRALSRQGAAPPAEPLTPRRACWDCVNYPKGGRSRGHCTLLGLMVSGEAENKECFRPRPPKLRP